MGTRDRLLADAVHRVTYAAEYTQSRPVNEPSQSNLRFIMSGRPSKRGLTNITFNAAMNLYDNGPDRGWRDAQAALQIDQGICTAGSIGITIIGAYYFQYMIKDGILSIPAGRFAPGTTIALPGEAARLLGTKGPIHIGQAKVTFALRDTGITFPIALTFSNRTELIDSPIVRGNFGVAFDLDQVLARLR